MIELVDVFKSVDKTLRASIPGIEVYKERINRVKRPVMSVELISFNTRPHSRSIINKSIDLDIIYFSKNNSVGEALVMADKLMSAFSMGLSVRAYDKDGAIIDKRHIHCLKAPEYKLVDQDLHFLVRFDFADIFRPTYLADDMTMKPFDRDMEDGQVDKRPPKSDKDVENRGFVEDVKFETDEDKKSYEEEKIKLMQSLKLEYIIMED